MSAGAPGEGADTCLPWADQLSCDSMRDLATRESLRNAAHSGYLLLHPACARFQTLADRKAEHDLQKTAGSFKKTICIDKSPKFQDGPWKAAYPTEILPPPVAERFEQWTRAKMPRLPGFTDATHGLAALAAAPACPPGLTSSAPGTVPDFWDPDAGKLLETCKWSYAPAK